MNFQNVLHNICNYTHKCLSMVSVWIFLRIAVCNALPIAINNARYKSNFPYNITFRRCEISSTHHKYFKNSLTYESNLPIRWFFAACDTVRHPGVGKRSAKRNRAFDMPPKGYACTLMYHEREANKGDEEGLVQRVHERERENIPSVELQFRVGWTVDCNHAFHPIQSPCTPSSVSFSFRLNVTIITGKALHTHAANRGARRRNYIDISIVSASRLIN